MRKLIILILLFTLARTTVLAYYFANGLGTIDDPYQIDDLADLIILSSDSSLWNKCFEQTADIDASSTLNLNNNAGFSPIGINISNSFTGSYNGNEFTISNLYIYRPYTDYIGLFGRTEGANISNIALVEANITGQMRVGALAGHINNSTIINNCYAIGIIHGRGIDYAGGLIGSSVDSAIINSHASGSVLGNNHVGGLVGYSSGPINNCYSSGNATGSVKVGGLIGISYQSTINNCYATGNAHGSSSVGGLAGNLYGASSSNCYSTGFIQGNSNYIGGLVGEGFSGSVSNSFWNVQSSGQTTSQGGTGKTSLEMKNIATYLNAGWDLSSIWLVNSHINSGYPFLINNIYSKLSIPNHASNVSVTPTISLKIIEEFGDFELYCDDNPNPEITLIPFSTLNNPISYTFTEPLDYYTDYYWSVLLYDADYQITTLNFTFKTRPPFPGLGTETTPYQIATIEDLKFLSNHEMLWDKHFIQIADIDASSSYEESCFNPLGNSTNNFTGSYNGNGYLISNLYINRPITDCVGIFGYIDGATISNVSLINSEVIGLDHVGSLVGYAVNSSSISNCYASGEITSSGNYAGGLVGYANSSTISNTYTRSLINGTGLHFGGLVGYTQNTQVQDSFWDIETTGLSVSSGGTGKISQAMTNLYTYMNSDWDFVMEDENGTQNIWNIHPTINNGYPFLIPQKQIITPLLPKTALYTYPNNEGTNLATSDNLVWQNDFLDLTLGYKLNLGTDYPPSNAINNQDLGLSSTYNYSHLEANTTFFWQVIPYNSNGDAIDCPIWSFTTGTAKVLSIGQGANSYQKFPIYYTKAKSYTQSIYLQSEINMNGRNIENLAFYLTDDFISSGANQWIVYLGHTEMTEFSNNNDWLLANQGLTEVATITFDDMLDTGWLNIELTTPFVYNNIDNLIVGVIEYSSEITENPSYFYTVETNVNRSLTYGHDSATLNPDTSYNGIASNSIPKMNFTFSETEFTGLVKNFQNQPISNAVIDILGHGSFPVNQLGEFSIYNLVPGNYQLSISAPWYETQVLPFKILDSEENYLEIILFEELLAANNVTAILAEDFSNVCITWSEPAWTIDSISSKQKKQKLHQQAKRTRLPSVSYNLYRYKSSEAENQENWVQVALQLTTLTYCDSLFPTLDHDSYYWAVKTVYSNNRMAEAAVSNEILKQACLESNIGEQLDFSIIYLSNENDYRQIILTNSGNGNLTIDEISCNEPAFNLIYDDLNLCIEPNATFSLAVEFIPDNLGIYSGELIINNDSSNEPNYTVSLNGTYQSLLPAPPANIQVTIEAANANITWDAVTQDINHNPITPSRYVIYANDQYPNGDDDYFLVATTQNLSFIHNIEISDSDFMFYKIKALIDIDNDTLSIIEEIAKQKRKVSKKNIERKYLFPLRN